MTDATTGAPLIDASGAPGQSPRMFDRLDLQPFTAEGVYAHNASLDFHLFFVGRDDVHSILKQVISRARVSL